MNAFEAINTRISVPALTDPGPTDAQWEILLRAGARAPDHGRLQPWRFLIVRGAARELLGDVMAAALRASKPDTPLVALDRERRKPLRAPARPRIFFSRPTPLGLAQSGARARPPIATMLRERSACPRRAASSPSSILARPMLRQCAAPPPSRRAPQIGGQPRENSPCRRGNHKVV